MNLSYCNTVNDGKCIDLNLSLVSSSSETETNQKSEDISQSAYVCFSVILIFILTLGLIQNSFTLFVFLRDKCIRKSHNVFIVGLAVSDVSMCVFGVWMVVVSALYQKWIFGYAGCVYYGLTTTTLGLTQIALLAAIALDRYTIIVRPPCAQPVKMKGAIYMVIFCYLFGFVWALLPAVGWSSYQLEGIQLRCAINWRTKDHSDISYLLCLLVCAWLVPLVIILFCYAEIFRRIRKEEKTQVRQQIRRHQKVSSGGRFSSRDKQVAITAILMIAAFFLSWAPYSVVTLIVLFKGPEDIPMNLSIVPALFAKSSIIWNPIIYVARHGEFRRACRRQFKLTKILLQETTNSSGCTPSYISKSTQTKPHSDIALDFLNETKNILHVTSDTEMETNA